jgi:signal peptidase
MKIATRILFGILALVLIGLGFVYFAPGYDIYMVRSQSMEPTVNMGDLIITGPTGDQINEGDIVTFKLNDDLVTHRVNTINETTIKTKGDNVDSVDPWTITSEDVQGKYIFKIPYVGWFTKFIRTKVGWIVSIIVPALILVIWLAKDIVKEALKTDEKKV